VDALARDLPVPAPAEGFDAFPARVRARIAAHPRRRVVLPVWGWAVAATLLLAVVTPLTLVTLQRPREAPATVPAVSAPAVSAPAATTLAPLESMKEARAEVVTRDARTSEPQQKAKADEAKVLARRQDAPALKDTASSTTGTVGGVLGGTSGVEQAAPARPQVPAPGGKNAYAQATPAPETMAQAVTVTQAPEKKRQAGAGDRAGFSAPAAAPAAPEASPPAQEAERAADKLAKREKGVIVREEVTVAGEDATVGYAAKPTPAPERTLNGRLEGMGDLSLAKPPFASVAAARQARDAWRAYVGTQPLGPGADEARVRIIEAGLAAWELSREEPDRTVLRRDIAEYLARRDAAQAERVRALRRRLEPR
jgi:hypothetical protein